TVPTFTLSVPSATRIFAIVPSSTASNSIVALSVSISAMMSPDLTTSPSLTSHLASVPSSMVGDSAGIFSAIAISIRLHQHVGVKLGRIRLGGLLGEIGGFGDDLADFGLDRLQFGLADAKAFQFALARLDRVRFVADRLDFLAAARLCGVRHGMPAIAIGLHLQDDRALAAAHPFQRFLGSARARQHVHAVDL